MDRGDRSGIDVAGRVRGRRRDRCQDAGALRPSLPELPFHRQAQGRPRFGASAPAGCGVDRPQGLAASARAGFHSGNASEGSAGDGRQGPGAIDGRSAWDAGSLGPEKRRGPRTGRPAAFVQCRVHLHDPGFDRRGLARPGPGVPGRFGLGRGVHERGAIAGDVALTGHQIPRCGQGGGSPCGPASRWGAVLFEHFAA